MVVDLAFCNRAVLSMAAVVLIAASVIDARRFLIPNWACAALLALFPFFVVTAPSPVAWGEHVAIFVLVLLAGFALYARKFAGAGDIKLLSAASLWAGPALVGLFLLITAIAGGLLSLVTAAVAYRRNRIAGIKSVAALAKVPVPYGVAIAIGGLCVLIVLSHSA